MRSRIVKNDQKKIIKNIMRIIKIILQKNMIEITRTRTSTRTKINVTIAFQSQS